MRKGSAGSSRGVVRFVDELVANLRRAGAAGPTTVRADSGFWSRKLIDRLDAHDVKWSITVALRSAVRAAIQAIPGTAWTDIAYTNSGHAQVAETEYTTGRGKAKRTVRLVVRRTRLTEGAQQRLWPDWRHHAFNANTEHDTAAADEFRRAHAVVELAIRDLKEGTGLEHVPYRPLRRELRTARLRSARPQHRPPDHHARRRAAGHEPLPPHPTRRPRRRRGQPLRHTHPAIPRPLALGNTIAPSHKLSALGGALPGRLEDSWSRKHRPLGKPHRMVRPTTPTRPRPTGRIQRQSQDQHQQGEQQRLWPDWRHHAFNANTEHDTAAADEFHRAHAVVELAIRDLKEGTGLEHVPSGHYGANCAPLACAVLAHNIGHPTTTLAGAPPATNRSRRTRLVALAAVAVNRSGTPTLRYPARWPWETQFRATLSALRALPGPSG